jgi:hypothetical protein
MAQAQIFMSDRVKTQILKNANATGRVFGVHLGTHLVRSCSATHQGMSAKFENRRAAHFDEIRGFWGFGQNRKLHAFTLSHFHIKRASFMQNGRASYLSKNRPTRRAMIYRQVMMMNSPTAS